MLSLTEKMLPQPPSFSKKKQYEIHEVLGTGTFGKVMVRSSFYSRPYTHHHFSCCLLGLSVCYQRATWHVPPEQINVALRGAAATLRPSSPSRTSSTTTASTRPPLSPSSASSSSHSLSFPSPIRVARSMSGGTFGTHAKEPPLKRDVALKVIPKKKVKGNEASVWGEMEVLKGLDHPNIVSVPSLSVLQCRVLVPLFRARCGFCFAPA